MTWDQLVGALTVVSYEDNNCLMTTYGVVAHHEKVLNGVNCGDAESIILCYGSNEYKIKVNGITKVINCVNGAVLVADKGKLKEAQNVDIVIPQIKPVSARGKMN